MTFSPALVGARTAELRITDDGGLRMAFLHGIGVGVPAVSLTPASLSFPNTTAGTSSASQHVELTNPGTAALVISAITTTTAEFVATSSCPASPASLPPGGSCGIDIEFRPVGAFGTRNAELRVASNAAGNPHVTLDGRVDVLQLSLTPAVLDFGDNPIGQPSSTRSLVFSNTGTLPAVVSNVTVQGATTTAGQINRIAGTPRLGGTSGDGGRRRRR